jgi:hypothetical protein
LVVTARIALAFAIKGREPKKIIRDHSTNYAVGARVYFHRAPAREP